MINRVSNEQLLAVVDMVFEQARADSRLMSVAATDEAGSLVFALSMEAAHARILRHAARKAYTAAVMQRDTVVLRDQDQQMGKTLADWGDERLTHLVGGVVLARDGRWYGGLGVGGNTTERDDELSQQARRMLLA